MVRQVCRAGNTCNQAGEHALQPKHVCRQAQLQRGTSARRSCGKRAACYCWRVSAQDVRAAPHARMERWPTGAGASVAPGFVPRFAGNSAWRREEACRRREGTRIDAVVEISGRWSVVSVFRWPGPERPTGGRERLFCPAVGSLKGRAWSSQASPGLARPRQTSPGRARSSQASPGLARSSQVEPGRCNF